MGNTTSETDIRLQDTSEEQSCTDKLVHIEWDKVTIIVSFVVLGLINIMVILGNTLVIMAVFLSSKLRTVTNLFIVSLAVSDLMVGIAVLPFSTVYEVLNLWIFGSIWCKIWLAVDVWMCTASILNLCAISLDRYVAVTRPVSYPSIMSSKRAKILIALVWCASFVICLPPLVGWSDAEPDVNGLNSFEPNISIVNVATINTVSTQEQSVNVRYLLSYDFATMLERVDFNDEVEVIPANQVHDMDDFFDSAIISKYDDNESNASNNMNLLLDSMNRSDMCTCLLTTDKGYRIYSALGSFYLPMLVMMFFYWRIYLAAIETTRAINQGFRTTKSGTNLGGGRFDDQRLTLRIHRGRSSNDLLGKANGTHDPNNISFRSANRRVRNSSFRESPSRVRRAGVGGMTFPPSSDQKVCAMIKTKQKSTGGITSSSNIHSKLHTTRRKALKHHWMSVTCQTSVSSTSTSTYTSCTTTVHSSSSKPEVAIEAMPTSIQINDVEIGDETYEDQNSDDKKGLQLFSKMGKRNIKAQVKRFRNETKAAKTLGIIVGGFILCWLPFFTIYLIGAFCADDCIPKSLFAVFFWLGYCNSAINPCVYALFSRDFRHAFKQILCRCFMKREHSVKEHIVTMFPASLHLASFFEESEDGSNSH